MIHLPAPGPGRAVAQPTDVADEAAIERLVRRAIADFGRLDFLVNAAGIGAFAPVHKLDAATLDRVWAVNVRGAILLAKHVVPILAAQGRGAIVNVGSVSSKKGWPRGTPYVASKFALRGFAEALRRELADSNVQVAHLAPRATRTAINSAAVCAMNAELGYAMDAPDRVARHVEQLFFAARMRSRAIGWPERLFLRINAVFPALVDRALRRQLTAIKRFALASSR